MDANTKGREHAVAIINTARTVTEKAKQGASTVARGVKSGATTSKAYFSGFFSAFSTKQLPAPSNPSILTNPDVTNRFPSLAADVEFNSWK